MSTAGKVLTVLSMLLAALWVLLAASVTQLNRNGAKAVQDLQSKVTVVEKQVADTRAEIRKLNDSVQLERTQAQNDSTTLQARQSEVEKELSQSLESVSRVKLQLDGVTATVSRGKADSQQRLAEREAETKSKAESLAQVEKLRGENGQLLNELTGLSEKFRSTREVNKALVDRLLKHGNAAAPTRPASNPGTP
jgi:chromosome segregation ATPase